MTRAISRNTALRNWRSAAAGRSADPGLRFPAWATLPSLLQAAQARAICADCPVHRQLAFAVLTGQVRGIWGGLTERERYGPSAGGKLKAAG
jgi:WhiB family transcriptional regulator, redox-sensing transcriptional regulator